MYDLMEAHRAGEIRDETTYELSRRDVEAKTLDLLTRMIEVAKLPSPEQISPMRATAGELAPESELHPSMGDANAKACLLVLASFRTKLLRHIARLRTAAVAVAAESYRKTHQGRWPEKLSELTPELLRELPLDPYDGEPLRYHVQDDSIVIYSVGPDLVDDGGRIDDLDIFKCTDIGIRLWNVDKRHQIPFSVLRLPRLRD